MVGCFIRCTAVDGRNPAQVDNKLIRIISHYLQGFFHPRWCMISSINSRVSYLTNPFCILVSHKKHRDSEDLALASTLSKSLGDWRNGVYWGCGGSHVKLVDQFWGVSVCLKMKKTNNKGFPTEMASCLRIWELYSSLFKLASWEK